jgi:hypothetical protein
MAASLLAQTSGTGVIKGKITDTEGRPAPRIVLEASNEATKAIFRATTSAEGEYSFTALPAGSYSVMTVVSAISYTPTFHDGIKIGAGQTADLNIQLQEGVALNTLGDGREYIVTRAANAKRNAPTTPTPRLADGKPDFAGYWTAGGPGDSGVPEFQDWALAVSRKRVADAVKDAPSAGCLPNGIVWNFGSGQKLVHTPTVLVMLNEGQPTRQIYLDGRRHPADPDPTWLGHSIGRWEGETLVVDSVGFNDKPWLDLFGHPQTEKLHLTERFHRADLGHMDVELTVDDPGSLKKPWVMKRSYLLNPDDDILEYICTENEKDAQHVLAK